MSQVATDHEMYDFLTNGKDKRTKAFTYVDFWKKSGVSGGFFGNVSNHPTLPDGERVFIPTRNYMELFEGDLIELCGGRLTIKLGPDGRAESRTDFPKLQVRRGLLKVEAGHSVTEEFYVKEFGGKPVGRNDKTINRVTSAPECQLQDTKKYLSELYADQSRAIQSLGMA